MMLTVERTATPAVEDQDTPPLPHDSVRERRLIQLFAAYKSSGDLRWRNDIVREYAPLVNYLASRFANRGEPVEDLCQIGFIGLLKSIERFDVNLGVKFRTYALPTVVGEMKRYMRDNARLVRMPRRLTESWGKVRRARDGLTYELGRFPTTDEIARHVNLRPEDVLGVLDMDRCWKSLNAPRRSERPRKLAAFGDSMTVRDTSFEDADNRTVVGAAMRVLRPREQTAILLSFYCGLSQLEIADAVHVSQMQVSRILRHALDTMKGFLQEGPPDTTDGRRWQMSGDVCH